LVKLLPYGTRAFSEVGLTIATWWLLGLEDASGAFDHLIRRNGIEPGPDGEWRTEVVGEGGRSDLEYNWGDPLAPNVIVEAKIGHHLHHTQLAGYRARLPKDGGLLVVLVPGTRRPKAKRVLEQYRSAYPDDPVRLDVWSFDDVADALEAHLPESSDVAQLRPLIEEAKALDIAPLEEAQLLDDDPTRLDDIIIVFDYATYGLFDQWLPSGTRAGFEKASRNVSLDPYPRLVSVGVGLESDQAPGPRPWVWLRVSDESASGPTAQAVLAKLRPGALVHDDAGAAVPLIIPAGQAGGDAIEALRGEIEEISIEIRDALDALVETYLSEPAADVFEDIDGSAGSGDVEEVVLEAVKKLRGGTVGRSQADASYTKNYWIRVEPFETYVAVAFHPKTSTRGPGPWLRVHRGTTHAGIAMSVLEELDPDRLVDDGEGLAIPIDVTEIPGPMMATTAYRQIHTAMNAIRRAILASHEVGVTL
jgi:hypothetical protein